MGEKSQGFHTFHGVFHQTVFCPLGEKGRKGDGGPNVEKIIYKE